MSKGNNIGIFTLPSLHSWAIGNGLVVRCCCVWQQQRQHLVLAAHRRPFLSNPLHGRERPCRGTQHHEAGRHHHLQRSVNRNNSNWHVSNRKVQRPCRRPSALRLAPPPSPTSRDLLHHVFLRKRERFDIYFYELCGYDAVPFSATYYDAVYLSREREVHCTICTIHTYLSYL